MYWAKLSQVASYVRVQNKAGLASFSTSANTLCFTHHCLCQHGTFCASFQTALPMPWALIDFEKLLIPYPKARC